MVGLSELNRVRSICQVPDSAGRNRPTGNEFRRFSAVFVIVVVSFARACLFPVSSSVSSFCLLFCSVIVCCVVLPCLLMPCVALCWLVLCCLVSSCLVMFCLSSLVLPCLVLSCLVVSSLVLSFSFIICLVLPCLVLSYPVLSCLVLGAQRGGICGLFIGIGCVFDG